MNFHESQPGSQEDATMSRRKQTKPLRLNEDEELQTGKTSVVRQPLAGDGSLSTVCCDWTGCLGHCTPGDINCYLTGRGGEEGGETGVGGSGGLSFDYSRHCSSRWRMVWRRRGGGAVEGNI